MQARKVTHFSHHEGGRSEVKSRSTNAHFMKEERNEIALLKCQFPVIHFLPACLWTHTAWNRTASFKFQLFPPKLLVSIQGENIKVTQPVIDSMGVRQLLENGSFYASVRTISFWLLLIVCNYWGLQFKKYKKCLLFLSKQNRQFNETPKVQGCYFLHFSKTAFSINFLPSKKDPTPIQATWMT